MAWRAGVKWGPCFAVTASIGRDCVPWQLVPWQLVPWQLMVPPDGIVAADVARFVLSWFAS